MELRIAEYCVSKYETLFSENYDENFVTKALKTAKQIEIPLYSDIALFRSRKNIDERNEDISNPNTFSYPKSQYCIDNGRANLYGFPVFYASDNAKVTIEELRYEQDDIIFIGEWYTKTNCLTKICFITTQEAIKNGPFRNLNRIIKINSKSKEQVKLINLFLKEPFPYSNSSAFSYVAMNNYQTDIIFYPSNKWLGMYNNLAINPEYVDSNMFLKRVFKVWIQVNSKSHYFIKLKEVGINVNGKVVWELPNDKFENDFFSIMGKESIILGYDTDVVSINELREKSKLVDIDYIKKCIKKTKENDIKKSFNYFKLGLEKLDNKDYHNALIYINTSISLCNFIPMYYYNRGQCYYFMHKYDDAIIDYTNAIILGTSGITNSNSLLKAYCNRGSIYQNQEKYDLAMYDFKKALEIDPNDYITNFNIGNCFLRQGKLELSKKYYDIASKIKINEPNEIINTNAQQSV